MQVKPRRNPSTTLRAVPLPLTREANTAAEVRQDAMQATPATGILP